jgi:hypothetical protein
MKRFLSSLPLMLIFLAIPSCNFSQPGLQPPSETVLAWQESIDSLHSIYDYLRLPDYLVKEDPVLAGDEFDVMTIFSALNKLKITEGYLLDYFYHHDLMGGFPVLYIRETGSERFKSEAEFFEARPECLQGDRSANRCGFIDHIETDGSELGYLQLIHFYQSGNQFYLDWHAFYNDRRPYATAEAIDRLVRLIEESGFWVPLDKTQAKKARAIDPTPLVQIEADSVTVKTVWFTHWGGFYESSYNLNPFPPYEIEEIERTNLVDYDCDIRF